MCVSDLPLLVMIPAEAGATRVICPRFVYIHNLYVQCTLYRGEGLHFLHFQDTDGLLEGHLMCNLVGHPYRLTCCAQNVWKSIPSALLVIMILLIPLIPVIPSIKICPTFLGQLSPM